MTLKLVTYEGDMTQFLVNAEYNVDAIKIAHEANIYASEKCCGDKDGANTLRGFADDDFKKMYTVDPVSFSLLTEIVQRNDLWFVTDTAIVYSE